MTDNITPDDVATMTSLLGMGDADEVEEPKSPQAEVEGDEIAPEEPASDEDEAEESEPEAEEAPAIDPPSSWSAADKATFAKLPPEAQRIVADRESERERGLSRRLSEVAEERKAAQAEREAISQQRQQYAQTLAQHEAMLRAQMMGEFSDLKSPADLSRLSKEDPTRYVSYLARMEEIRAIEGQQKALADQQRKDMEAQIHKFEAEQRRLLAEKAPDFIEGPKAKDNIRAAKAYLGELGFTDEEIAELRDHRLGLLLRDALKGREMAKKAQSVQEKRVVKAPRVASPGPAEDEDTPKTKAAIRKIARHGRTDDQVAIMTKHFADFLK